MNFFIKYKGSIIALLATISFSNVYIFSKKALSDVSLSSFGLMWFLFAIVWSFIFYKKNSSKLNFSSLSSKSKFFLLLISLSELIATTCFFLSIQLTDNPAVVSFIANMSPIFVLLMSFLFLKERYGFFEIIGIFITLLGVLIINMQSESYSFSQLYSLSSLTALIFAFFYGISLMLVKYKVNEISSSLIALSRNGMLFIGFLCYTIYIQETPSYTLSASVYILLGSFLGPFLGVYLSFLSLKYIKASLSTLILTSRSLFIILTASMVLGIIPSMYQFIGGGCTIIGVVIISIAKTRITKN